MRELTEQEKIIKTIRNSAITFLDKLNSAYNRGKRYRYSKCVNWYINTVNFGCRTYVSTSTSWYDTSFYITLDADNILTYADYNNVDIETATKTLISHEIFHIVLGHFSSKYKDYNKRILNIAGDLEINQLINLQRPGLQVEDFGFKPFRNTEYYYDLLIKELEEILKNKELMAKIMEAASIDISSSIDIQIVSNNGINNQNNDSSDKQDADTSEEQNKDGKGTDETNESTSDSTSLSIPGKEKSSSKESDESGHSDSKSLEDEAIDELIPEGSLLNEKTVEVMQKETIDVDFSVDDIIKIENTIKKELSKDDTYEIDGLNEIIRKIINKENSMKITPHGRQMTYYKFNNRRKSDFILPGKRLTNDGIKKKFDSSPVIFIDVSGSTHGRVNIDLMNVAKKLHKIGATIVYYNGGICSVCEPKDRFFTESASGGTDITYTVREYLKHFDSFERAYVFTDGQDSFSYLKSVCDKFNVYFIRGNKYVYEKYNEKSNIPAGYYHY